MRARNIKPGFFKNNMLSRCSPLSRILFTGLWCYSDRSGFFEYRPEMIKVDVFPYDDVAIPDLIDELGTNGLIQIYEDPETKDPIFGHVVNFEKHQNPHKNEKRSEIKPIIESCTLQARYNSGASRVQELYCKYSSTKTAQFDSG